MAKSTRVERPIKKSEHVIRFGSREASKGWQDLVATQRNAAVEAWEFLTKTPDQTGPRNYRLKGVLSTVMREGVTHQRWQHKPTLGGTARIWFYIDSGVVILENVHTAHLNATK